MKKRKRGLWLGILFLLAFGLLLPRMDVHAKAKLNKTSLVLKVSKSKQLKVTGTSKKITWSTSNKNIASVSKKGVVKAKKAGNVTIKAKYGSKTLKCKVYVVALSKSKASLKAAGSSLTLKVSNGSNTSWSSSNKAVAKVSSKGVVTAVKGGTATITCKSRGVKMTCKIYVPTVNRSYLCLDNTKSSNPTGSFQVSNSKGTPVYSSSDSSVVTINQKTGLCTGRKTGTATVYAKVDGYTYSCSVSVGVFTPSSWIKSSNQSYKYAQQIKSSDGKIRTYLIYGQGYSKNKVGKISKTIVTTEVVEDTVVSTETQESFDLSSYMGSHGCATCSTVTVLSGWASYTSLPKAFIENVEPDIFGYDVWKTNYKKSSDDQMPLSLTGVQKVLNYYHIKNKYVRSYSDRTKAWKEMKNHLLSGNPVIFVVSDHNNVTGKDDGRWTSGRHTMVMLGVTDTNKIIIADSADRANNFGKMGRVKTCAISDVGSYMFTSTKTGTSPYYTSWKECGGYILVGTE